MEGIKEYVANPSWNTRVLPLDMVTSSSSLIMKFQLILVLCIISCTTMYQIQAFFVSRRTADYKSMAKTLFEVWKQALYQIQHDQVFAESYGSNDEWQRIEKNIDFLMMLRMVFACLLFDLKYDNHFLIFFFALQILEFTIEKNPVIACNIF